ncbi:MAG: hypothetical protein CMB34_06670 [Euryarchaeota archaeon]|nr:hypothetical protein [Euryarchaeota archaeon]|tara:strand:- start:4860 stop:6047 length:1188 start_codon:yes stop_codon:yes gene_type:complete
MTLDLPSGAGAGPTAVPFGATRTLSDKFGADSRALALKIFSGTTLEQFYTNSVFYDRMGEFIAQRQLDGGHVAQFPVIGDDIDLFNALEDNADTTDGPFTDADDVASEGGLKAGYHNPGDFITGKKIKMSEKTVRVDDVLVAAIDVPFADLDLTHFDVLTPFSQKLGRSLATDLDRKIAAIALKAATTAAIAGVMPGGQVVENTVSGGSGIASFFADSSGGSTAFRNDVATLARQFDEDNVPQEGRFLFIPPYIRSILRHEQDIFNRDFNDGSVAGTLNTRTIGVLEGFQLILTNNLPGDWTGTTNRRYEFIDTEFSKYDFECGLTAAGQKRPAAIALCGAGMGQPAIGMVQASGMRTVIEDDERRNVKFMKAQMHVGFDVLAPFCSGVINMARS